MGTPQKKKAKSVKRPTRAQIAAALIAPPKRDLTPAEIIELQERVRLINGRRFEANQVKANTALVPNGQQVVEQLEAIARLLENSHNQYVSGLLTDCGYPAGTLCDINMATGQITQKAAA